MHEQPPPRRIWQSRRSEQVTPASDRSAGSLERDAALREQMIIDWSSRGMRRIEALLGRHAAFHDYLDSSGDN
jgi:hypothetical protein